MTSEYVLGINGWFEGSHDASAVLVEFREKASPRIIAGIEEDKVVGEKGLYDIFPARAVEEVLKIGNISPRELSCILIGWDYPLVYKKNEKIFNKNSIDILKQLFPNEAVDLPIQFVNHHLSHANSSHFCSKKRKSLSLVIDGSGELESTSLWLFDGQFGKCIETFSPISSFGFLFEATNIMMGFRENESGKTMGLSGYGEPVYLDSLLKYFDECLSPSNKLIKIYERMDKTFNKKLLLPYQEVCIRTWLYIFKYILKVNQSTQKYKSFYEIPTDLKNLAASVQALLEIKIIDYISKKTSEFNIHDVTISGGVALNCILNGKILNLDTVESIFVQPGSGDSGVSLGAALEYGKQRGYSVYIDDFSPYIGKEIPDDVVENYLKQHQIVYQHVSDASSDIALLLKMNKTVALFQGRNEWGPRALGNRTILSLAKEGKLDFINEFVKCRELGRPLAPSLLIDDYDKLLPSLPKKFGKYMNIAYTARKEISSDFSSVIHIDSTFRPQFVSEEDNSTYFKQLKTIKDLVGSSIVINTSFNEETPIIYSLEQVISFWQKRNIDAIVLNNKFILKR